MVDLLGPGVNITAGGWISSGTSQATPHVAGAIAAWQSYRYSSTSAFWTAFWMHKMLLIQSSAPILHTDGRRFQRLGFDQRIQWDLSYGLPYYFRESAENKIPSGSSPLEISGSISGYGWNVGGAYLTLDISHINPENVLVEVLAPNASSVAFYLPPGQAHFTGVVGRTILPGVFGPLSGSPVDGPWKIRFRDTSGTSTGNYLQAALHFVKASCTPNCNAVGIGDDTCGGSCESHCEACVIDDACYGLGYRNASNPCEACNTDADANA